MIDISSTAVELALGRSAHQPGSRTPHTVVILPSYSVGESLSAQYADRLLSMEHRQLLMLLMLPRIPGARVIFVTSLRPAPTVLAYYLSLVPPEQRRSMRSRIRILEVPDASPRSISAKLLDRPDLIASIRRETRGRLAYIEPWNATALEQELAAQLELPLNGTTPELWPLGFKTSGRRLMRRAGVPLPPGFEGVRTVEEVITAAEAIRTQRPDAVGAVVKIDNSAAGAGNRVIRFDGGLTGIRRAVEALEPGFVAELEQGGVVEQLIQGRGFACPSVQLDIAPEGRVEVRSTHEQLLGGRDSQVYEGCEFPARQEYGAALATYGAAVGEVLAERGVLGPLGVDFVVVGSTKGWSVLGLEINLRKSGTSHPMALLRTLVPGHYDDRTAQWITVGGTVRSYRSTDNLVDLDLRGRSPLDVIRTLRASGLAYDRKTQVGAVLHSFCALSHDGHLGLTTIGRSPEHARQIYSGTVSALRAAAVVSAR